MTIGYWNIRNPWNNCIAIDEFGNGTLDGNPAHGGSFDACGPAAIENAKANYENRTPLYTNIGAYRAHMISNSQWTVPSVISNPRTSGCFISNIKWEVEQLELEVLSFVDYQDAIAQEVNIRNALSYQKASTWIVTNAGALAGNEANIHGHFVTIAGYGGDNSDGSTGKLYVLNSDIAGQHGTATGQWIPLAQFRLAEPHGYVVYATKPPVPPKPPLNAAGIRGDVLQIQHSANDILVLLAEAGY